MNKNVIIKYIVAILAVLNLIWLFGFGYSVPGLEKTSKTEEVAEAASTATTMEIAEVIEEEPEEEEPEEEEQVIRCRVTAANRLNIRMGPGTNYEVVASANYDEILIVLGSENGWIHIRNDKGQEGYVSEAYVEMLDE